MGKPYTKAPMADATTSTATGIKLMLIGLNADVNVSPVYQDTSPQESLL
jgi:hypothetical protein